MGLSLIVGPPNSGRTGKILDAFRASLADDPVLVVPTLDDAERFERELTEKGEAVIGATVCTFERLFELVSRATEARGGPPLTTIQRRRVAREAAARTPLTLLAASAGRRGFAAAAEQLISELQAGGVDPTTFIDRAREAGPYEQELAALYRSFCSLRDELGRDDAHTLAASATSALRERPQAWGARPVFLYGFDDLTVQQLELIRELWRAAEVTVTLPYEDRDVITAARAGLFAELRDVDGVSIKSLSADPANTASATLFELERSFGDPEATPAAIENDGGVALLASAGVLAEAETVGAEVARLLHEGVPADEIAIVLRDPGGQGALLRRVLNRFDVPVATQAELAVTRTLTGSGLLALLDASVGRRRASDLLAYLRTPGVAAPGSVDWLERRLRRGRARTADQALEAWAGGERRELTEVERLRAAGSGPELLRQAAREARWVAEAAVRRRAELVGDDRALELRSGDELQRGLEQLAELGLDLEGAELTATIADLTVPIWRGPTVGRVRVISPYRARARRVDHLFVCSLQDGDFPRRDTAGPLLSDDGRAALALPPRTDAEVEDRYLFSVCLSRPRRRLWLSWRNVDDDGSAAARSPFVDQVRELLAPQLPEELEQRDEMLAQEAPGRGLSDPVFTVGAAPSEDELARAEAALVRGDGSANGAPPVPLPGLDPGVVERLAGRLALAGERTTEARLRPGPLQLPAVLEAMAETKLFGPSTLEEYALCPYRWFVQHELDPQSIDPDEEAPTAGQVAHEVLERLYREQPGSQARPTEATLPEWLRRGRELISEIGPAKLPRERADTAAALRRVEGLVLAFVSDEAAADVPYLPDPELAEASFGFEDADKPALPLSTAGVHGRIDRIDIGPGGEALVQDYKSSAKVDGGRDMLSRGKLQLQLYLLAVRELWGRELAGGLYRPLGGTGDRQPKGLLRKQVEEDLRPLRPRRYDHLDEEKFEATLEAARERAEQIVAAIQAGEIDRRPLKDTCPTWCTFQQICRRERALPDEEPGAEEEEEA